MPVLIPSAYSVVESILQDARAILNDMEVVGGDVLLDSAPFSLPFVNQAYRRIQAYLAQYGCETYADYTWLIGVPANATGDPETRIIISDTGTLLYTPTGLGEISYAAPILPDNLVAPLKLRERQSGTTSFAVPMFRRNDGLVPFLSQVTYLVDWMWVADAIW